ncbi:MAG: hypothetical protein ACK4UJ_03265 [Leptonema sp. (in: bacteria)]
MLPPDWISRKEYPVINLSGCPVHPNTVIQVLLQILNDLPIELDTFNRPIDFYSTVVHQGCTRNEYHEYDIEEEKFGELGCLFFNLGCMGPYIHGTCNSILWNTKNSKTRAGIPCIGCTEPNFPIDKNFYKTDKILNIPVTLPLGVNRANYLAYKGLAKVAAPKRLLERKYTH